MKYLVVLCLAVCALPCAAQQFWNKTTYGMTEQQVRALFGQSLKIATMDPGFSGLKMRYDFCKESFNVTFAFRDKKLELVSLTSSPNSENITCILREYTYTYGKPISDEISPTSGTRTTTFKRGKTIVEITDIPSAIIFIIYTAENPVL